MKSKNIVAISISIALLQGCVAASVVGIAGTSVAAADNRTFGSQITDQKIELNGYGKINDHEGLAEHANIQIISINGSLLIVGQVPNAHLKDTAVKMLSEIKGVKQIHNQLRIANTTSIATRTNDVWLTSKVKTALFKTKEVDATNIKVVTENGEVFLLGLITQEQANAAVEVTRNISGVSRVYRAFEYVVLNELEE